MADYNVVNGGTCFQNRRGDFGIAERLNRLNLGRQTGRRSNTAAAAPSATKSARLQNS